MGKRETIEKEVKKTLELADNINCVKASPFFFTRLKQRMETKKEIKSHSIQKPVLAHILILKLAIIIIIVATNIIILSQSWTGQVKQDKTDIYIKSMEYDFFLEEYSNRDIEYLSNNNK